MNNYVGQLQSLGVYGHSPDPAFYVRGTTDLIAGGYGVGESSRLYGHIIHESGRVRVINNFGTSARYTMTGGELDIEGFAYIAGRNTALFEQSGGLSTFDREISISPQNPGTATMSLSGGTLNAYALQTSVGTGRFVQTGGVSNFTQDFVIGTQNAGFLCNLELSGGSMSIGRFVMGGNGGESLTTLSNRGTNFTVRNQWFIQNTASLAAQPGFEVLMEDGIFENRSTSPLKLADLNKLTLRYEGNDLGLFEVAGIDLGPQEDLKQTDFAVGALRVGVARAGRLQLKNQINNNPSSTLRAALYVDHLEVGPNSVFDLNGFNVYVGSMSVDPTATIVRAGGELSVLRPSRAASAFTEPAIGMGSYTPPSSGQEAGFTTTIVSTPGSQPLAAVVNDTGQFSAFFSHRSVQATPSFAPVSLQYIHEATVTLSVQVAATDYEAGDYVRAFVTNGVEAIDLLNLQGSNQSDALEAVAGDGFLLYTASLPDNWQSAQLIVQTLSNSSTGAERFNFDNYGIHGIYAIPEPGSAVLAAVGLVIALGIKRHAIRHGSRRW